MLARLAARRAGRGEPDSQLSSAREVWLDRTAAARELWLEAAYWRDYVEGQRLGAGDALMFVPVDDPRFLKSRPPLGTPVVLSKVARKRWELAAALAEDLAAEVGPRAAGNDLVSAVSVSMPVMFMDSVAVALADAAGLAERLPHRVRVTAGLGRYVVLVQGESYSVVFGFGSEQDPVLVLVDEMPGYAVRVDEDLSGEGSRRIWEMVFGVIDVRIRDHASDGLPTMAGYRRE